MPIIKPISSLRNKTREITELCRKSGEPIFLTHNGEGDLVVMSLEAFEKMQSHQDLFEKLAVSRAQSEAGEKGITHDQMFGILRKRLRGKK